MATANDAIIETRKLSKSFKGFMAVNGVSLKVRRGTVHALIGPNGAGKTTFFNLVSKFLSPSSGEIYYQGHDITRAKPASLARRGLVRSFQISAVFPQLSALENVRVALQRKQGASFNFWRSERILDALDDRALALLDEVGLAGLDAVAAADLPYGRKRALEIAIAMALEPEMLLLDEPTAGMGREDLGPVVKLIQRIAKDRTVLMVEHNLGVVKDLSDTITVLEHGEVLAEGDYDAVSANPDVIEAYMGTGDA